MNDIVFVCILQRGRDFPYDLYGTVYFHWPIWIELFF